MEAVFIDLLNRSIAASWLILAVVLLRVVLRKAPKRILCVLWMLVALRLIWPFTWESAWSLLPSAETVKQDIALAQLPSIDSGIFWLDGALNPAIEGAFAPLRGTV